MMRVPLVSAFFFAAAPALLVYGAIKVRSPAPTSAQQNIEPAPLTRADRIMAMVTSARKTPDYVNRFNALDPTLDATETTVSPFNPQDDYFGLPRETGYELVAGLCGACHSLQIVMQQHATRERWAELMIWMTEKQGMAELHPEDEQAIVDYLTKHFGAG